MVEGTDQNTVRCLSVVRERLEKKLPEDVKDSHESERGEKFLPVCSDIKEFLKILRNSGEYRRTVDLRLKASLSKYREMVKYGGFDNPSPNSEEITKIYEESESFKQLFWNFNEDVLHLSYVRENHSSKFNELFEQYRIVAMDSVVVAEAGKEKEEIIEKDRIRSEGHNNAARRLVKDEEVETEYLARIIVRAFLVDIGEDYIPSARLSDQIRTLRTLTDNKVRTEYYSQIGEAEKAERFSPESIFLVQNKFVREHPGISFVDKSVFITRPHILPRSQGDQENIRAGK